MSKELRSIRTDEHAPSESHVCEHPGKPRAPPAMMRKEGALWICPVCGLAVADHQEPDYPNDEPTVDEPVDSKDQGTQDQPDVRG